MDAQKIEEAFAGTNFGGKAKTDAGRRGLLVEGLLKHIVGYGSGMTIYSICFRLGLTDREYRPTEKGLRWMFEQLVMPSGPTVVERLHGKPSMGIQEVKASYMGWSLEKLFSTTLDGRKRGNLTLEEDVIFERLLDLGHVRIKDGIIFRNMKGN